MKKLNIALAQVKQDDLAEFKMKLQDTFTSALVKEWGQSHSKPIPSDEDIWKSFNEQGAIVNHILLDNKQVGGVVLNINDKTQCNRLELFFILPENHNHGLGQATWKAIEAAYPETKIWSTATPYFEKRNIHFYVNKCGFHIVEFYNQYHPDTNTLEHPTNSEVPISSEESFFRFEKVMTP
ncbi:GNAT family N-acetyltransferase [Vibrio cincinnatiensis]|uniref:GNAT family N-acetyltransferase n=1 Tax=Vibrio cincinnatiensis TaxID=675 RepID=UPI001EDCAA6E|nr:GNAT family N-acetyltransferase [Vibrio cincinnatiensis]MCG3729319.1 N-acetyltransferase [Vibrio cincinnatiensis]